MAKRKIPITATPSGRGSGFQPGEMVVLVSTGECGVVVTSWLDEDLGARDSYVAFFGKKFPAAGVKPGKRPYVLRYCDSSLRAAPAGVG